MSIFPNKADIGNKQFFVCGYCKERIVFNGYINNHNKHILENHHTKKIIKPLFKEVVEIRKMLKDDPNFIWVEQMENYYPDVFITVYNYRNFIKKYKMNTFPAMCHIYQKSTELSDFIWPEMPKKFISYYTISQITQIHIPQFCDEKPICNHFGILYYYHNVGWFHIAYLTAYEILLFWHLLSDDQKKHFQYLLIGK
jgi:hypothetical protein